MIELLAMVGFIGLLFWGTCHFVRWDTKRQGEDPGPLPWENEPDYYEAKRAREAREARLRPGSVVPDRQGSGEVDVGKGPREGVGG
jgi:hypothetical protein